MNINKYFQIFSGFRSKKDWLFDVLLLLGSYLGLIYIKKNELFLIFLFKNNEICYLFFCLKIIKKYVIFL